MLHVLHWSNKKDKSNINNDQERVIMMIAKKENDNYQER